MKLDEAINHALDGNSVIFLGSGFSAGAIGSDGNELMTARDLAKFLSSEVDPVDITDDLMIASANYKDEFGASNLINIIKEKFTVTGSTSLQEKISKINWKYIFTTNYDNLLNFVYSKSGKKIRSLSLSDNPDVFNFRYTTCLHINGRIDELSEATLDDKFKLTNRSYLTELFSGSNWSFQFRRELENAKSIFFIGYSMYDIDIARIIFNLNSIKDKTFIIQRKETYKKSKHAYFENFGNLELIGIDGFWNLVDVISENYSPMDLSDEFFSLIKYEPDFLSNQLSDDAVWAHYLRGDYKDDELFSSMVSGSGFYIQRKEIEIIENILFHEKRKMVFVYSEIGNGKTNILQGVAGSIYRKGYKVFFVDDSVGKINSQDILNLLRIEDDVLLIVENYFRHFNDLKEIIIKSSNNLKVIASARTVLHELKRDELYELSPSNSFSEVCVDKIDLTSVDILIDKFNTYKIWGEKDAWSLRKKQNFVQYECSSEFSTLLLDIINSPHVKEKYSKLFSVFSLNDEVGEIFVTSCVLSLLGYERNTKNLISELLNSNYLFSSSFSRNEVVQQIAKIQAGDIIPRSSIFAKYALNHLTHPEIIISVLIKIARNAHDLGESRADSVKIYHKIYRDLVTFSVLQPMLPRKKLRESLISFYEQMKNSRMSRNHPHFWMQYAIARLSLDREADTLLAKHYLDAAYSHAKKISGYHTKHMDNVLARYYVQMASYKNDDVNIAELAFIAIDILKKEIISEKSDAPYKVISNLVKLFINKKSIIRESYQKVFELFFNEALVQANKLPDNLKNRESMKFVIKELEILKSQIGF